MLKCLEMVESYPQFDIPHLTSFGSHSELGCISVQGMEILHLLPFASRSLGSCRDLNVCRR